MKVIYLLFDVNESKKASLPVNEILPSRLVSAAMISLSTRGMLTYPARFVRNKADSSPVPTRPSESVSAMR